MSAVLDGIAALHGQVQNKVAEIILEQDKVTEALNTLRKTEAELRENYERREEYIHELEEASRKNQTDIAKLQAMVRQALDEGYLGVKKVFSDDAEVPSD